MATNLPPHYGEARLPAKVISDGSARKAIDGHGTTNGHRDRRTAGLTDGH